MKSFFHHLIWLLKGVQVYALVGESGTGKSFRARLIAEKYGISHIIDDGLLIKNESIIAGRSAKEEKNFITAIKTALFDDPEHRKEVIRTLEREKFKRLLILGTSEGMITKIVNHLDLPFPQKIIRIEEVATQKDIETAKKSRLSEVKHIIPVPALEIKRNYPHIFYDSIRVFLHKNLPFRKKQKKFYEKAVVQPEFSGRGRISISENALSQMVIHCIDEFNPDITVRKITIKTEGLRYRLDIEVVVPFGGELAGNTRLLQKYIIESISKFTGISNLEANITISDFAN
jgi:hypothetical protein